MGHMSGMGGAMGSTMGSPMGNSMSSAMAGMCGAPSGMGGMGCGGGMAGGSQPSMGYGMTHTGPGDQKGCGKSPFGQPSQKGAGGFDSNKGSKAGKGFKGGKDGKDGKGFGGFGSFGKPSHKSTWSYGDNGSGMAGKAGDDWSKGGKSRFDDEPRGGCAKGGRFEKGSAGFDEPKAQHTNLHVGSLPEDMSEISLKGLFEPCGVIQSVYVNHAKRFGFVEFSTVAEAEQAIERMNGQDGLQVSFSNSDWNSTKNGAWDTMPHSNVYVSGLPGNISEPALKETLESHGGVQSCVLKTDAESGNSFGFVKFVTVGAAARAIAAYENHPDWIVKVANNDTPAAGGKGFPMFKGSSKGWGLEGWSWTPGYKGGSGGDKQFDRPEGEPNDNLYVRDLPPDVTEEQVLEMFARAGHVLECRVFRRDPLTPSTALVRMGTTQQATTAKAMLHDSVPDCCTSRLTVNLQQKSGETIDDHIYVTGIHWTTSKEQVEIFFGKHGDVLWSRLMPPSMPPTAGFGGGGGGGSQSSVALIQYRKGEHSLAAVEALHNTTTCELGAAMVVRFADQNGGGSKVDTKPNSNLYVKGWPVGFPEFLLTSAFEAYGKVQRIKLLTNPDPDQATRAALVQMGSTDAATQALRSLHGRSLPVEIPPMHVKPAGGKSSSKGKSSDNLYVTCLPRTITEADLRETFKKFGEVHRLRILQQTSGVEAHALVQLSSPELAMQAVRQLDGASPFFKGPLLNISYALEKENRSY